MLEIWDGRQFADALALVAHFGAAIDSVFDERPVNLNPQADASFMVLTRPLDAKTAEGASWTTCRARWTRAEKPQARHAA
jgi:hypothetical protein